MYIPLPSEGQDYIVDKKGRERLMKPQEESFVFSGDNERGTFSVNVCESTKLLCVAYFYLCIVFV